MYDDLVNQPHEEDAFLSSCGPLGSKTSASFGGKFLGEFASERRARAAIRLEMMRSGYYPNVWNVSDHGNYHLTSVH